MFSNFSMLCGWKLPLLFRRADCCGIVGYIGPEEAEPVLVRGIRILQNRGYDSCGIATRDPFTGRIITTKYASKGTTSDCVELLASKSKERHAGHFIGIGHTRWATHGGKTDTNAHPHSDWKQRIALVHNGSIDNFLELKDELLEKNISFTSATDSEVVANLIGYYLDEEGGRTPTLHDAVAAAVSRLIGTWGLVVMQTGNAEEFVCARNGSPLLIGCSEDAVVIGSESSALASHSNTYVPLRDGEVVTVIRSKEWSYGLMQQRQVLTVPRQKQLVSPSPHPHWTIREILEQPKSLARALNYGGRISAQGLLVKLGGLEQRKEEFAPIRHLVISGCGTSFYAGLLGQKIIEYLGCFETVNCVDASELTAASVPSEAAAAVFLSQSGETLDVIRAAQLAERRANVVLSVVNAVGSHLARLTNCGVYLNAGREVAVASTKAFSSQVLVMALLAAWFHQNAAKSSHSAESCRSLLNAINRAPLQCGMVVHGIGEQCKQIAGTLQRSEHIFVLGKGFAYPVALEASLKIKEITYIHAEGFTASALKHGPFALLDEDMKTPVILLCPSDETLPLLQNCAQQVKARGAHVIAVVDDPGAIPNADEMIVVPENGILTALNMIYPLQLIAYELAVARNIDPGDRKSVV